MNYPQDVNSLLERIKTLEEKLSVKEKELKDKEEIEKNLYNLLCGRPVSIANKDFEKIISTNEIIVEYLYFDYNNHNAKVVIEGVTTREKFYIEIPKLPNIGGCVSIRTSNLAINSQIFISGILEMIKQMINHYLAEIGSSTKVIKVDRCLYAPYILNDEKWLRNETQGISTSWKDLYNSDKTQIRNHLYHDFLKENYPDMYFILNTLESDCKYDSIFWSVYHNSDVLEELKSKKIL